MEAYKELHRHKRNEEKRQEQISCFQQVWTAKDIFGRLENHDIKWHLTPPPEFLPQELGAWMAPPINILRRSPSPDSEADFAAQPDFSDLVQEFLQEIGNNFPLPSHNTEERDPPQSQQTQHGEDNSPTPPLEKDPTNLASTSRTSDGANGHPHHTGPPTTAEPSQRTDPSTERQPLADIKHNQVRNATTLCHPTSRPKTRCKFGPRIRTSHTPHLSTPSQQPTVDLSTDALDIENLLREIDNTRLQDLNDTTSVGREEVSKWPSAEDVQPSAQRTTTGGTYQRVRKQLTSRPKVKCRFGPYIKSGQDPRRRRTPLADDEPPTPRGSTPDEPSTSAAHTVELPIADIPSEIPTLQRLQCQQADRITFTSPTTRRRSPFARYYHMPEDPPVPNTNRFALARLGISAEELQRRAAQEATEELTRIRLECQLESLTSPPGFQRILTKEDCLLLFTATGVPPPGPLLGIYRWAANLGVSRYNFEIEDDCNDFSFMNAYD